MPHPMAAEECIQEVINNITEAGLETAAAAVLSSDGNEGTDTPFTESDIFYFDLFCSGSNGESYFYGLHN